MVNEWTEHPLEQCMAAIIDYRGKTPRKTSAGIPLITAKVVKSGRIETPDEFIALEDYDAWMRRGMPKPNDVLITTEAPLLAAMSCCGKLRCKPQIANICVHWFRFRLGGWFSLRFRSSCHRRATATRSLRIVAMSS